MVSRIVVGIVLLISLASSAAAQSGSVDDSYTVIKEERLQGKRTWTLSYSGFREMRMPTGQVAPERPKLKYVIQFVDVDHCGHVGPQRSDCDHPLAVGQTFGHHDAGSMVFRTPGNLISSKLPTSEIFITFIKYCVSRLWKSHCLKLELSAHPRPRPRWIYQRSLNRPTEQSYPL